MLAYDLMMSPVFGNFTVSMKSVFNCQVAHHRVCSASPLSGDRVANCKGWRSKSWPATEPTGVVILFISGSIVGLQSV